MHLLVRGTVFGLCTAAILLGLSVWQWHAGPADVQQILDRSLGGVAGLWGGALMRDWARGRRRSRWGSRRDRTDAVAAVEVSMDATPLFQDSGERQYQVVPLAQIEPPELRGARNPLGPSMGEFGILTPLELYPAPEGSPYRYRVSAGSRRFHTARDVGLTDVPAFVSSSDGSAADITGIENLGRSNNPVAEALALRKKLNQGYTLKAIADLWGAPLGTLKKRARLLELPEWVLPLVGEQVAVGVVEQIAGLNEPYRTQAVEALQAKVAGDPGAKFTADDLKGARVAQQEDLGDVLGAALLDAPAPLIEVDVVADLAGRVGAMARHEGVDLTALAQALLDLAGAGTVPEESAAPDHTAVEAAPELAPLSPTALPAVNRPPSRVRATRSGAA